MIYATKQNERQLIEYAMSISSDMVNWQIVTVRVLDESELTAAMEKLMKTYEHQRGLMFKAAEKRIVMLVQFGNVQDYTTIQQEIASNIPEYRNRILVRKPTASGIKQLQIDFTTKDSKRDYFEERQKRDESRLMLIDDDFFIRKTIETALDKRFEIESLDGPEKVMERYKDTNPDMVLLDLHMPNVSGWKILDQIISEDADCYVVLLSADSARSNVLQSRNSGAVGFITKPPEMKAMESYIKNCPTIKRLSVN